VEAIVAGADGPEVFAEELGAVLGRGRVEQPPRWGAGLLGQLDDQREQVRLDVDRAGAAGLGLLGRGLLLAVDLLRDREQATDGEGKDVPLYRRRVYAVAHYTMARRSELAALTAGDVDFAHEMFRR
jgi:hypothetical protein